MDEEDILKKENIQVYLRIRPLLPKEMHDGELCMWRVQHNCIQFDQQQLVKAKDRKCVISPLNKMFFYSHCYGDGYNNAQIYTSAIMRIVQSAFNGYNGTVFMYGQTGSGKTHTMLGDYNIQDTVQMSNAKHRRSKTPVKGPDSTIKILPHDKDGLLTLSMKDIFCRIKKESSPNKNFFVKCSYFEIYNDYIYDLLAPKESSDSLLICEDSNKEFYIKGLTEVDVKDADSILSILNAGEQSRHYAETVMNRHSSRSHTVFKIVLHLLVNSNYPKGYDSRPQSGKQ